MLSRLLVGLCVLSALCVVSVSAYNPNLCEDCMGGMPMPKCPSPSACGDTPVDCTTCIPMSPACKYADYCSLYTCDNCMDGMPMNGCPDPGVCGFKPIKCVGCQVGNTTTCPRPDWCFLPNATSTCTGCMDGQVTSGCPDPSACGYAPACTNCMAGMAMPDCPNYDACQDTDACMMEMVFNTGHHACVLFASWNISSGGQWFGTVIAIFFTAFLREFIAFYRSYALAMRKRAKESQKYSSVNNPDVQQNLLTATSNDSPGAKSSSSDSSDSSASKPSPLPYAYDSFLYLLQHTFSYLLMLIIMTYNFYLFMAVVGSFAICHFLVHYGYAAYVRPHLTKQVPQFKTNGRNAAAKNDVEEKTGGDHCCEDIDIE